MPTIYDAVVIGAGHNGLTCACYLAKAGLSVLVVDQYHMVGGMTVTEEITLPGFRNDLHAFGYQFANLSPVPKELGLADHGFELIRPEINFTQVHPDGGAISMHRAIEDTMTSLARHSKRDAATWRDLASDFISMRQHVADWMNGPPASFVEAMTAVAQMPHGMDEYRFELQSTRSWGNQTFESEAARVFFGAFACHASVGPDDIGGAHLAWLFTTLIQDQGNRAVKGGMHNLSLALASYLKSKGGAIRTNARVQRISVSNGRAIGVVLDGGEEIAVGKIVASAVDPRQLVVEFLGADVVGADLVQRISKYEWGDAYLVVYLALDGPLTYRAGADAGRSAYVHPAPPSFHYLARIYSECRSGILPAQPLVVMCNDASVDPSRAPPDKAVMKLIAHNVPYDIKGDATGKIAARTWDAAKEPYADHLIDMLASTYVPDLKDRMLKRVVHSPLDMERAIPSAVRGTVAHGAFLPYQLGSSRPIPELGRYRAPVSNVYMCASGSHPGGGVSMAPGRNAARVIVADLRVK
jgi:phytoene dehydrogenase-like protein